MNQSNLLLENESQALYNVYFTEPLQDKSGIVINDKRELELLYLCIGDRLNVVMDVQDEINHKDLYFWLSEKENFSDISKDIRWNYKKPDEVYKLITKISIPEGMKERLIKQNELIDQKYVHKYDKRNIMLSSEERVGNMFYFLGHHDLYELHSDHLSDHLDGIKIYEVARQAFLASMHLIGQPFESVMILTKSLITYNRFVELDRPYYIHTIPVGKTSGGAMFCVYNIIQDDISCSSGYISGFTYRNRDIYNRIRISKASEEIG